MGDGERGNLNQEWLEFGRQQKETDHEKDVIEPLGNDMGETKP